MWWYRVSYSEVDNVVSKLAFSALTWGKKFFHGGVAVTDLKGIYLHLMIFLTILDKKWKKCINVYDSDEDDTNRQSPTEEEEAQDSPGPAVTPKEFDSDVSLTTDICTLSGL